ncbi:carbohydrate ABC transporter permease [Mesorhizobium sp. SP-1A]|uniref:carbohydrate ABC transporter permease n=1 Tax=Mesorhizobium sp. SP-1A TaxID=3077840 RepID=UPI0028F7425C|nr:carbohydrate ABC transporter permease [Mesorhizobium sp. SP-1A]
MVQTKALAHPLGLKIVTGGFIGFWSLLAAFPLAWIVLMSVKLPLDAFADDPLQVVVGYGTLAERGGISIAGIAIFLAAGWAVWLLVTRRARKLVRAIAPGSLAPLGWLAVSVLCVAGCAVAFWWLVPALVRAVEAALSAIPGLRLLSKPILGLTTEHYRAVWFGYGFYRNFINSLVITFGTVAISLTVGTLAGYGLARANSSLAFWLLIAALIFRALPHSVLVTGYLPAFINSRALLMPLWNAPLLGPVLHLFSDAPPTLYGQPLAVIMVLVSINQPFTIWMLRSFFQNIPQELDEAARVDGCSHFGAFWRVIMPVMWPGVITTGLFSFLLAYNDYLVCSLLLDAQSQTMVPAITGFFNRETTTTDQVQAVAAAVSITAPLFLLVMVFQKQLVSGLTAGAVKG